MTKLKLPNVTLYGTDTIDLGRQLLAFEICMMYAEFAEMKIFADVAEPYTTDDGIQIFPSNVASLYDYNHFNLKELNSYIDTEFVMIAEHDGFILNPDAWMDEFLDYDYIGAPWYRDGEYLVGNGGFSIRSKKLLEFTQSDSNIQLGDKNNGDMYAENEDWVLGFVLREYVESKGIRFAPSEIAKRFSFEAFDDTRNAWTDQFGFHGLKWTDISKWLEENPQYKDKIVNELE